MATLELQSVTKRFDGVTAVEDISLRIEDNEFFCIFGPPSCGKTTILRILLGLVIPDEGRVLIDGVDVTYERPRERDLGMVFQNLALFPHLTAGRNIAFPLTERGEARAVIARRVNEVAEKLQITKLLKKLPAHLSGGERQRVAIARALVRNPSAYLMDEPIAALDARLRETTRVELKRLQRELNHTLVYVTHDQEEAMSIADRIAIMQDGRIVQTGTPSEIYNAPMSLFTAEVVGSPRINVVPGQVSDGRYSSPDLDISLEVGIAGDADNAMLAVRPEDLAITAPDAPGAFAATVYEVEPLGGHTIVDVQANNLILRALLSGQSDLSPGQSIGVRIDQRTIHLFDRDSGDLLQ